MQKQYHTIILSPHLDDAALSCGGFIYKQASQGQSTLIATLMAGDPPSKSLSTFAQQLHARWELATQVVQERREEDIHACGLLGADFFHGDIPDCIYRGSVDGENYFYESEAGLFGHVHPEDTAVTLPKLIEIIANLPPAPQLLIPLTLGNHVDHQLVRLAAEKQANQTILYYEDYPYAQQEQAVDFVIGNDRINWEYKTIDLDQNTLHKKADAIAAFESQMSTFFNGRDDLIAQLQTYANQVGGERLWRKI